MTRKIKRNSSRFFGYLAVGSLALWGGCRDPNDGDLSESSKSDEDDPSESTDESSNSEGSESSSEGDDNETSDTNEESDHTDWGDDDDEPNEGCNDPDQDCFALDVLFVIDNSGTMAQEQMNLARNFPRLIERLRAVESEKKIRADVNLMITTTDMGHPSWEEFRPAGKVPARGRPTTLACLERLDDFNAIGSGDSYPEACTDFCSDAKYRPNDDRPYLHFRAGGTKSNIPDNDIVQALSCMGAQGVNGCGYESPLESMMQALNPNASWNQGKHPFLREGAVLAIVLMSDESDCSVQAPDGYDYFTDDEKDDFWMVHPDRMEKVKSSAICWNGGVKCDDPQSDGSFGSCTSKDRGVLHPLERYRKVLIDQFVEREKKKVVMLGILGVPPVTAHAEEAPHQPTEGGVFDLKYQPWDEAFIPTAEADQTAALKDWEFGIGPGCVSRNDDGEVTGYAMPPVRARELCESLNQPDKGQKGVRCCIESICDDDFSAAMDCLAGLIDITVPPK